MGKKNIPKCGDFYTIQKKVWKINIESKIKWARANYDWA